MMIDKLFSQQELQQLRGDAPVPLYYRVYALLKERILDGSIPNGIQIPTEQQLAAAFSVSRITAKRAMDELAAESLVERRRGRGTYVTHRYKPEPVQAPLVGMLEKLASMGRETRVEALDVAMLVPPGDICANLKLANGEKACRVTRVRFSEDVPFAHYVSWTPGKLRGFTKKSLERRVRLDIMRENGVEIHRVEQYLGAGAANTEAARLLKIDAKDPLLTLTRYSYNASDDMVDILFCQYHPKRFQYRMSLSLKEYQS